MKGFAPKVHSKPFRHDFSEFAPSTGASESQERSQSAREGLHPGGADDRDCDCWDSLCCCIAELS